jgi:uncharacterized membrane protein YbaN (DUF454 family)
MDTDYRSELNLVAVNLGFLITSSPHLRKELSYHLEYFQLIDSSFNSGAMKRKLNLIKIITVIVIVAGFSTINAQDKELSRFI